MNKNLKSKLMEWDGKSSDDIAEIYEEFCNTPDLVKLLVNLLSDVKLERASSWMLKRHLEIVGHITQNQIDRVYQFICQSEDWQSQLHILQSMPYQPIAKKQVKTIETFLRRCLMSDNKFVRAWTYNGFDLLAKQYPQYREEVDSFFEMAMRDEAPAVTARIRNILKNNK